MATKIISTSRWGCVDQAHANDCLIEICDILGAKTKEDSKRVCGEAERIVRAFLNSRERDEQSFGISESRKAVAGLIDAAKHLRKAISAAERHLTAGYGGATDIILANPMRPEQTDKQQQLLERWKAVSAEIEILERETNSYVSAWGKFMGGRLNVYTNQFGPPKRKLVENCYGLFEQCRPGKATMPTTGDFYKLCIKMYELATGADEEHAGLQRDVQTVVGAARRPQQN